MALTDAVITDGAVAHSRRAKHAAREAVLDLDGDVVDQDLHGPRRRSIPGAAGLHFPGEVPLHLPRLVRRGSRNDPRVGEARAKQRGHHVDEEKSADDRDGQRDVLGEVGTVEGEEEPARDHDESDREVKDPRPTGHHDVPAAAELVLAREDFETALRLSRTHLRAIAWKNKVAAMRDLNVNVITHRVRTTTTSMAGGEQSHILAHMTGPGALRTPRVVFGKMRWGDLEEEGDLVLAVVVAELLSLQSSETN